jgi:hypothetical protein
MGQSKMTNKMLVKVAEAERLAWNAALDAAVEAVVASEFYYKQSLSVIRSLTKHEKD